MVREEIQDFKHVKSSMFLSILLEATFVNQFINLTYPKYHGEECMCA